MITDILHKHRYLRKIMWAIMSFFILHSSLFIFTSCARMGAPDGGWYDETPPRMIKSVPEDRGTDVKSNKIALYFNEFIKLDNPSERVIISPPQLEQPEIKATGKHIMINLKDSLQKNTTYTIDFSDAITDFNEGNPMGNFTYVFSTGTEIDTLEVSGVVLNAEDLEPLKGILVGLYRMEDEPDTAKTALDDSLKAPFFVNKTPFQRVSRTDSRGRFIIKGVAPGRYTVGALMDSDGDYSFTQLAEKMAFSHEVFEPSCFVDRRQDTIWADALHIKDITTSKFIHYTPDNIVLKAFAHNQTERHFIKAERKNEDFFTLYFTAPLSKDTLEAYKEKYDCVAALPRLKPLNFEEEGALVIEPSLKGDTITYWLKDTALINTDTLRLEMMTLQTDTTGTMMMQTDTLEILAKTPYAKRLKTQEKVAEDWKKSVEKKRKRLKEGEELTAKDTIMPVERLKPTIKYEQSMRPDGSIRMSFATPMKRVETDSIHLYVEQDSLWYRAPFTIEPVLPKYAFDTEGLGIEDSTIVPREWEIYTDWIPGAEYSFEIDTLAFEDIYGKTSEPYKTGIRVKTLDEYSSLFVNVNYPVVRNDSTAGPDIIVQMLDAGDKPVRSALVENGTAEFYYVTPGNYFLRAIIDSNRNGEWDTGNYELDLQPEEVYYYKEEIQCKQKWDITKGWTLQARPLYDQKPAQITKQKAEEQRKVQNRNAQRAAEKGIEPPKR